MGIRRRTNMKMRTRTQMKRRRRRKRMMKKLEEDGHVVAVEGQKAAAG